MKSSSIQMVKSGIESPKEYRDSIIHDWYLPNKYKQHLSMYILAEAKVIEFFKHSNDGELLIKGKKYSITFIHSPEKLRKNTYCLISLRYSDLLERGYALVKVLEGNGQFNPLEYK